MITSSRAGPLGIPLPVGAAEAEQLGRDLATLWEEAFGTSPANWLGDLDELKRFFDPVATGRRLRQSIAALPDSEVPVAEPFAIPVGDKRLITPEGRAALELVRRGDSRNGELWVDPAVVAQLQADLLDAYRSWSRHRLMSVVELIGGGAKPLQMPAMGSVLVVLVNRSDVPARAIPRYQGDQNPRAQEQIDAAVFACAEAFASTLQRRNRRKPGKERLISGWTLHEVTRRLPGAVVIDDVGVYVGAERRNDVIDLLGKELAQRKLRSERHLEEAFDELVNEFRARSGVLAAHGALFERPADTATLRELLVKAWKAHAA